MSISVLVPIADGSEELEAITMVDVLRRAEASVTLASIASSHRRVWNVAKLLRNR